MSLTFVSEKSQKISKIKSFKLSSYTDESWKEILSIFFKDFMAFAWPKIYRDIDWDKGFEFLDKELQSLVKHEKKGKRVVDKLIKLWHKNMGEVFIILHIEVQDEKEIPFSLKMFIYYYRLRDRYKVPVVSLAVLIDKDKGWRPNVYEEELWDCHVQFKYPILKLIDYESQKEELGKNDNPFALIILCQLSALHSRRDINLRFTLKYNLTKTLLKKKWSRDKITALLKFLDGILRLPEPMEFEFVKELKKDTEESGMSYVTSFEYFAQLRGIEIGESRILLAQLKSKFKIIPKEYLARIQNANPDILLTWANRLLQAQTIEEVFLSNE